MEKTNWINNQELKKLVEDKTLEQWYGTIKDMFLDAGLLEEKYDIPAEEFVNLDYLKQAMQEIGVE